MNSISVVGAEDTSQVAIPRPLNHTYTHTRTYKKVHQFVSWGVAYKVLSGDPPTGMSPDLRFISTPLLEIPWDRLGAYMNRAEFDYLLQSIYIDNKRKEPYFTVTVEKMKCSVRCETPRTAFQTQSTDTTIGTIHQNKFITKVTGLNKTGNSINSELTFGDTDPMIPTKRVDVRDQDYDSLWKSAYGYSNDESQFDIEIPRSLVGQPLKHNSYATLFAYSNNSDDQRGGWPDLRSYTTTIPADACIGEVILKEEYTPVCGLICNDGIKGYTQNIAPSLGTGQNYYVHKVSGGNGMLVMPRKIVTKFDTDSHPYVQGSENVVQYWSQNPTADQHNIMIDQSQLIEKSQWIRKGMNQPHTPSACPSIHVGIEPIPALSTPSLGLASDKYTDVQAWWIVELELEIQMKAKLPRQNNLCPGMPMDECYFFDTQAKPDTIVNMIGGLYQEIPTTAASVDGPSPAKVMKHN